MKRLRTILGAAVYDLPRYFTHRWIEIHNRNERVTTDGRGVRCEWEFTSELHLANVFPALGARLMRAAFAQWPVVMRSAPAATAEHPDVAFVIGHRGTERLPHLLTTLRSIAGQSGASVECIVIEQDREPRIEAALPDWVRYRFTPCETDYNRAATLNAGVAESRAPIVVLHDNDMLVPSRYAAECVARANDGCDFLELKRFTFYLPQPETERIFAGGDVRTNVPSAIVQNLLGASIAVRRSAYEAAGGFDEEFVGWGGEDNEFWERAEASGQVYRFGYLPFLHLFHAPQKGKLDPNAPAVRRYYDVRTIAPAERIKRLRSRS